LLQEVTWFTGTRAVLTAVLGVFAVGTAVVGFIDRKIPWPVRAVLLVSGLMLLVADLPGGTAFLGDALDIGGLGIFTGIMFWQWWTGPRAKRLAATEAGATASTTSES